MNIDNFDNIKANILVVDDEYANRLLIEAILNDAGYLTTCASSGYEALNLVQEHDFALVILDIQMPGMDGFELLKKIHSVTNSAYLPIIFVSAVYSVTEYQEYAIGSGAVDFLSKPLNAKVLLGKVKVFTELYIQKKKVELYRNHLEELVTEQYNELRLANLSLQKQVEFCKSQEAELKVAKEKAEDADKLKTAFLNNLSHEIRTPLNAIVCCSDIISMPDTDKATFQELSWQIKKSTRYLLNLVDNIISISKLESGSISLDEKPTDLVFLFNFIYSYNKAIISHDETKQKTIQLLFNNQIKEHSFKVLSDENFLRQIVSLLIENAIKFTEHGIVSLLVNIDSKNPLQEYLHIEVKDTGIGISEEDQPLIFDKFRKVANMGEKIYEGAGIGLAIIKKQIGMLNGTIDLESKLGVGSKFTVRIPITRC
ncbi:MAG: response regulator [Bacteroidales bacterium]|nr:response regulator [Bacteroidales bacterium]